MIKKYMLMTFFILSSVMAFNAEQSQPSCSQETALIERYTKNYQSAIRYYNQLRQGAFDGGYINEKDEQGNNVNRKMTDAENNALLDALEAKKAASLPWGFKWLATCWVENFKDFDTKLGMDNSVDAVQPVVKKHIIAMIGKKNDANQLEVTTIIDNHALKAVVINAYLNLNNQKNRAARDDRDFDDLLNSQEIKDRCTESYENLTEDNIASILSCAKSNNTLQYNQSDAYFYQRSMRLHKQEYKNYQLDQFYIDNRFYFCKNLLPMIEERDKHIARLKAENPIDTNATTNKFAALFDSLNK